MVVQSVRSGAAVQSVRRVRQQQKGKKDNRYGFLGFVPLSQGQSQSLPRLKIKMSHTTTTITKSHSHATYMQSCHDSNRTDHHGSSNLQPRLSDARRIAGSATNEQLVLLVLPRQHRLASDHCNVELKPNPNPCRGSAWCYVHERPRQNRAKITPFPRQNRAKSRPPSPCTPRHSHTALRRTTTSLLPLATAQQEGGTFSPTRPKDGVGKASPGSTAFGKLCGHKGCLPPCLLLQTPSWKNRMQPLLFTCWCNTNSERKEEKKKKKKRESYASLLACDLYYDPCDSVRYGDGGRRKRRSRETGDSDSKQADKHADAAATRDRDRCAEADESSCNCKTHACRVSETESDQVFSREGALVSWKRKLFDRAVLAHPFNGGPELQQQQKPTGAGKAEILLLSWHVVHVDQAVYHKLGCFQLHHTGPAGREKPGKASPGSTRCGGKTHAVPLRAKLPIALQHRCAEKRKKRQR